MTLLRSIRTFGAIAIFATILMAFLPLGVRTDGQSPSMACQTCSHPDMALTACPQASCPIIIKISDIDHHALWVPIDYVPLHMASLDEWRTEPPVPPG